MTAFERSRPLTPHELRKLSKGLQFGSESVVVAGSASNLRVEGVAALRPDTDGGLLPRRVHAVGPGRLVFEEAWGETAVMDRGRFVPQGSRLHQIPAIQRRLEAIFGLKPPPRVHHPISAGVTTLVQRIRGTGSGGILALFPSEPTEEDLRPDFYRLADPGFLARRIRARSDARSRLVVALIHERRGDDSDVRGAKARLNWETDEQRRAFDLVGRPSAIDGAVLAGPELAVYGAGYIIESGGSASIVASPASSARRGAAAMAATARRDRR